MAAPKTSPAQSKKTQETVVKPNPVQRFIRYAEDSRAELRKVTWPTVPETRKSTLAVLGFVAVMALILGLVDLGLSSLIKTFLS